MNRQTKEKVLAALAALLAARADEVVAANQRDLAACSADDAVIYDRLKVTAEKVAVMRDSVLKVLAAPDPCGRVISSVVRENGLRIENRTVPFGTILIIYEARPDVSIEAAAIALKAGNRILLKGGKEARATNLLLTELWREALESSGADTDFVRYLDLSREETQDLIAGEGLKFDVVIPRGGDALINFVRQNSNAPVIVSGRGNNFAFVDADCDFASALPVLINGKSRLSVCNALDKVLIDANLPEFEERLRETVAAFREIGMEVLGDDVVCRLSPEVASCPDETWFEEFLAARIAIAVTDGLTDAINRINKFSGGHSATILTRNADRAAEFMEQVDCAAVYHNASTRFTDGGEFGLGAEIAISTQKLHARGPLGAEQLVTNKWFVFGDGQTR